MSLKRAGPRASREVDDAAARLVARARVVVLTVGVITAALFYGTDGHTGLQYALTFVALPISVALALAADSLPPTVCATAGASLDVLVFSVAVATFPSAVGTMSAAFLVPVLLASYTAGRPVGALTGVAGVATVAVADATGRIPPANNEVLLLALATTVAIAVVGRADARLLRTARSARRNEERAVLLLQHLAEPVVVTASTGILTQFNGAAHALLQIPSGDVTCAQALRLRVDGRELDCSGGCGLLALEGSQESGGVEAVAEIPGGEPIPVLVSVTEIAGGDDATVEYLHTLRDITKLKLADEAKTLFLATATHELKTPLTVIRGFLDTISQPGTDAALRETALGVMRKRADELSTIIERVLLASRIESGKLSVDTVELEGVSLARERVAAMAAATGRTIALRTDAAQAAVLADEPSLATVLDHLLDNACKYSPPDSPVEVAVHRQPGTVGFAVRDEGRGMTAEEAQHCFDRFWQADPTSRRRVGGTGIGLYIVRSLTESMGGTITVTSAPGAGTTFVVSLRRADAVPVSPSEDGARDSLAPQPSIVREFMRQIGVESKEGKS